MQLRGARTLDMLQELSLDGWVEQQAVKDLTEAYAFLRTVEHRLQMLADEFIMAAAIEIRKQELAACVSVVGSLNKYVGDKLQEVRGL